MENGNSYVVRERGGGRREEAREEGGAERRPRPPRRGPPRRDLASSCCGRAPPDLGAPDLGALRMLARGPASRSSPASSPFRDSHCLGSGGCAATASSSSCRGLEGLGGGKARKQERRGGKSCSQYILGRGWRMEGWRGVPGSPPPPDHPPVQGTTVRTGVRGARVTRQAMSLRGDGNEPMWSCCGLARTEIIAINSFPFWEPPGRPPPSLPPLEG